MDPDLNSAGRALRRLRARFFPGFIFTLLLLPALRPAQAKDMTDYWSSAIAPAGAGHPDTRWFQEAKFGLFMHWGLYSVAGNEWDGKTYYGTSEWLMNRAKIPANEYARLAKKFDPADFNAGALADFAREAGFRYVVITAKHHEGFAMFDSKVSAFNIVAATPYKKDPMRALAAACRADGLKFGFYYSQFLDWHEPDGGGNTWDFKRTAKNYPRYYAEKSIAQIQELLANYGPLGLVWFDMPGGLSQAKTAALIADVRRLQPQCLISSRVGQGLGDFRDFGDSELPPRPSAGPWEALFTINDTWGYSPTDVDFKSPREILHLLAATAARGGNLLLNVGPDAAGRIPDEARRYLLDVGRWLGANGAGIYGTAASPIPDQPWGVATMKPGRLFLHVFARPRDGVLFVPNFSATARGSSLLVGGESLRWSQQGEDLRVSLPEPLPDTRDTVVAVEFSGALRDAWSGAPAIVSSDYEEIALDAANARTAGAAEIKSLTSSWYFGDWKHDPCVLDMKRPADRAEFSLRFLDPGDYRVILEYACPAASAGREGIVEVGGQQLRFQTLLTGEYNKHKPLLFIRQPIGVVTIARAGAEPLVVYPRTEGGELCWLRRVVLEPVQ